MSLPIYEKQNQLTNFTDDFYEKFRRLDKRVNNLEANDNAGGGSYILIRDEKASGTAGGGFTSGAWQTRTLNTESVDTGNHATLAGNQITLAAGTYRFRASAPAFRVGPHKIRLQNITAGSTIAVGTSENSTAAVGENDATRSEVSGQFTLSVDSVIEVQHRGTTTRATDGFGVASSFAVVEVFTVAEFWKA